MCKVIANAFKSGFDSTYNRLAKVNNIINKVRAHCLSFKI